MSPALLRVPILWDDLQAQLWMTRNSSPGWGYAKTGREEQMITTKRHLGLRHKGQGLLRAVPTACPSSPHRRVGLDTGESNSRLPREAIRPLMATVRGGRQDHLKAHLRLGRPMGRLRGAPEDREVAEVHHQAEIRCLDRRPRHLGADRALETRSA